jgi:hypothetical protein
MDFPKIRIQTTNALMEIHTQQAQLSIEQPPAELRIHQPPAEMQIDRTHGMLTIDQTKAWENLNLKSVFKASEDAAQQGHQDVMDGIARRVQEGDELMKIENPGNPIKEQAKRHYLFNGYKKLGWYPTTDLVNINYDPGKLEVNWKISKPNIESKPHPPIINSTPGGVEINTKQYPSVKIDFDNLKLVGLNYEITI